MEQEFHIKEGKAMDFVRTHLDRKLNVSDIVSVFRYNHPKDFISKGEKHDFWEFIYVYEGEVFLSADGVVYNLEKGEIAFHKPNEFHTVAGNGKTDSKEKIFSFVCTDEIMREFEGKILFLSETEKEMLNELDEEANRGFTVRDDEYGVTPTPDQPLGSPQLVAILLERFLLTILRNQKMISNTERILPKNRIGKYMTLNNLMIEYLSAHTGEKLNLDDIGEYTRTSVSTLKRAFRQEYGCGIMEYFNNMKILIAKNLIKSGKYTFTDIAEQLGFDNSYYFSTSFKRITGVSPTQYMKEHTALYNTNHN